MEQLSDHISQLAARDSVEGEDLIEALLGDSVLNYAPHIDSQEPSEVAGQESLRFYEANELLVEYVQIDDDGTTRADVRSRLRSAKRAQYPLFYIVAESSDSTGANSEKETPIRSEFDILRVEPVGTEKSANLKYFTFDLQRREPFYFELLADLRYGTPDSFTDLQGRVKDTFQTDRITKQFYEEFSDVLYDDLIPSIEFTVDELNWSPDNHAKLVVNRLLFLLFIQEKGWLNGNKKYIQERYKETVERGDDPYESLFKPLFFNALCESTEDTSGLGDIPYFNSELFQPREFQTSNGTVSEMDVVNIDPSFFGALLTQDADKSGLFQRYRISIQETNPAEQELVIDPEFVGRVFEAFMNSEERSKKGAFYTPKPVTQYMVKNSLKHYLCQYIDDEEAVTYFVCTGDSSRLSDDDERVARDKLQSVKTVDPAIGSGAFAIAMLDELHTLLSDLSDKGGFGLKKEIVSRSIYGVDIDSGGVELCQFRVWLSLIQELDKSLETILENNDEYTLPNMNLHFIVGNSLSGDLNPSNINNMALQESLEGGLSDTLDKIHKFRDEYYHEHESKDSVIEQFEEAKEDLRLKTSLNDVLMEDVIDKTGDEFIWSLEFPEIMFDGGFDIVIGNPPYEGSSKQSGIAALSRVYDSEYGFYEKVPSMRYDLYQKFIIRGWELAKENGVVEFITSNTFLTLGSKKTTRNILQSNDLHEVFNASPKTFDAAVHPAIFSFTKTEPSNDDMLFIDGSDADIEEYPGVVSVNPKSITPETGESVDTVGDRSICRVKFDDLDVYRTPVSLYETGIRGAFFKPSRYNLRLHREFASQVCDIAEEWEQEILDSESLESNWDDVYNDHIQNLEPGDVSLVGLLTVGGQGLSTGRNRDFIAYLDESAKADKIKSKNGDSFEYEQQNEKTIGRGKMGRVVTDHHTTHPESVSSEERENGFESDGPVWVPIEKGFREEDRYYKPTDSYINWSESSVQAIDERGVIRNPQYYFRDGVFIARGGFAELMARYIDGCVIDSTGAVLVPKTDVVSSKYLVGLLNSDVCNRIADTFINASGKQVNDARMIPVPIPSKKQRSEMEELVEDIIEAKSAENNSRVKNLKTKIDRLAEELYHIDI